MDLSKKNLIIEKFGKIIKRNLMKKKNMIKNDARGFANLENTNIAAYSKRHFMKLFVSIKGLLQNSSEHWV